MDNMKKHKIFDDDAVVVEKVEVEKKDEPVAEKETMKANVEPNTIMVEDVLDSFAGYLPNRLGSLVIPGDGECMICGAHTISPMRKVCVDCMVKYGEKLYNKAKHMLEVGEVSFKF